MGGGSASNQNRDIMRMMTELAGLEAQIAALSSPQNSLLPGLGSRQSTPDMNILALLSGTQNNPRLQSFGVDTSRSSNRDLGLRQPNPSRTVSSGRWNNPTTTAAPLQTNIQPLTNDFVQLMQAMGSNGIAPVIQNPPGQTGRRVNSIRGTDAPQKVRQNVIIDTGRRGVDRSRNRGGNNMAKTTTPVDLNSLLGPINSGSRRSNQNNRAGLVTSTNDRNPINNFLVGLERNRGADRSNNLLPGLGPNMGSDPSNNFLAGLGPNSAGNPINNLIAGLGPNSATQPGIADILSRGSGLASPSGNPAGSPLVPGMSPMLAGMATRNQVADALDTHLDNMADVAEAMANRRRRMGMFAALNPGALGGGAPGSRGSSNSGALGPMGAMSQMAMMGL